MISYNEANEIIELEFRTISPDTEYVELQHSLGRVLAENVVADIDEPPFNNSAMDGIAVKYNPDISSWKVLGTISAGNYIEYTISDDSCARIMTGAKVPPGTDTVIPVEDIDDSGDMVHLNNEAKVKPGQNIRLKGENLALGEVAVKEGTLIKPVNISMLATCGCSKVKVYKRMRIGVLATGDELVEVNEMPEDGKIRASNIHAIAAEIKSNGHIPVPFGIVRDDKESLERQIREILHSDIDILVTSGGVSVGKYDFLKEILEQNGMTTHFWRTYIKPGKPLLFGSFETNGKKKYIFGLPGNPVSSLVTYIVFVRANLNAVYKQPKFDIVTALLTDNIKKRDAKRHFARGILSFDNNTSQYLVGTSGSSSSGNMVGLNDANCLMIIEEERTHPQKGEKIACIMI